MYPDEDEVDFPDPVLVEWGRLLGRMHRLSAAYRPSDPAWVRPGWESDDDATIALGRLAVECRAIALLEGEDGERWRFTVEHAGTPVSEYVRRQGRFRHLGDADLARLQQQVDARWQKLERRVRLSAEP